MLRYIFIILFFSSCLQHSNNQKKYDLFLPINLNIDTTKVFLNDFIINENIDSVTSETNFLYFKDKQVVYILTDDKTPFLSVLTLWSDNKKYDILLRKNQKKKVDFAFNPKGKVFDKVYISGDFNNWSQDQTQLSFKEGIWKTQEYINPGKYQYQLILDGQWFLDTDNPSKALNSNGQYNSLLTVEEKLGSLPKLSFKLEKEKIQLFTKNADKILVFYNNTQIPYTDFVKIPSESINQERSYIRVFSFNQYAESNSLLIPLQHGKVVEKASDFNSKDKYSQVLYFILVDRFFNGNFKIDKPIQDPEVHSKANYYGGDLEGVCKKLEEGYFTKLGINTIWLSPITQNPEYAEIEYPFPHRKYSGYHGYWPVSCTEIDKRFGDKKTLKKLVKLAHDKNIKVLLDFVSNHVHKDNPVITKHPDWATDLILENGEENIRIWDQHRLTTWFDRFLPTIDYSIEEAVELMTDSALFMIEEYNLDGFRHDATKHIPTLFWRTLTNKIKTKFPNKLIYQIGETFGSRELIGSYVQTGQLDGQFDFNLYFDARRIFALDEESFKDLHYSLEQSFKYYGNHSLMGNITGNHDIPRFISFASKALSFSEDEKEAGWNRNISIKDTLGYNKLKMLTAFITTIPGVPVIYYGDEIGMVGAGDPDNRRPMVFDMLDDYEISVKNNLISLLNLRNKNISLIYGEFNLIKVSKNIFIYERTFLDDNVVVCFNKDQKPITIYLDRDLSEYQTHFTSIIIKDSIILPPYSFEILTKNNY